MTNENKTLQEYREDFQKRDELLKKAIKSEAALVFILDRLIFRSDFNSSRFKILDFLIENQEYFGIEPDEDDDDS
jgi:hypothetical protein